MSDAIGRALAASDFAVAEVHRMRRGQAEQRAEYTRMVSVLEADAVARRQEAETHREILAKMADGFAASVGRSEAAVAGALEVAQLAHARADAAFDHADEAHGRLDVHDDRLDRLEARRWALWVLLGALVFGGGVAVGRIDAGTPHQAEARP